MIPTIEEVVRFLKKEYCDIEQTKIPKEMLPWDDETMEAQKFRFINRRQLDELSDKFEKQFGQGLRKSLLCKFSKISVRKEKNRYWFFFVDDDNWDVFYKNLISMTHE